MNFQTLSLIAFSSAILSLTPPQLPAAGQQVGAHGGNGLRSAWQTRASGAKGPQLIEFDVPGTITHNSPKCTPYCGTFPNAINRSGTIVGTYLDKHVVPHGFILNSGQYTVFDAPGAGLGHGLNQGTVPRSINDNGEIAGQYEDSQDSYHGFVRHTNGKFETVNVPGAGTGPGEGSRIQGVNSKGALAGFWVDSNNMQHGFVRSAAGFTTFDPPNSTYTYICLGSCFNAAGSVVGNFYDGSTYHGFIRLADGTIRVIDGPQALVTEVNAINDEGKISGWYLTKYKAYGFELSNNVFTSYQVLGDNTQSMTIDPEGAEAGLYYPHEDSPNFLYYRKPNGMTMTFAIPGSGKGYNQGLSSCVANALATVTGYWKDSSGLNHGYMLTH